VMNHLCRSCRIRPLPLLLLVLAACSLSVVWLDLPPVSGADEAAASKPESKLPPLLPLKVDKSAPLLLLEEPAAKEAKSQAFLKINAACFVCHENYREEPLAVGHAKQDVGCTKCHGESLAHREDEDNLTPPDKMFSLAKIDASCQATCHDTHDAPAREVLKRWQQRCPEKTDAAQVVCTDCHGYHRLPRRTVSWNRDTGALLMRATTGN